MKRVVTIVVVLAAAAVYYFTLQNKPSQIAVEEAKANTMMGDTSAYVVGLGIRNAGPADELIAAVSPTGETLEIINPEMPGAHMIVPGGSTAIMASDGVHLRLSEADFEQGAFLPITLTFKNAGDISTRVENAGPLMTMHDITAGLSETPAPMLVLEAIGTPSADGFEVSLKTENFTFLQPAMDADHVQGEGHGHVYLNGLKLGRAYADTFKIGALPSGTYRLTVGLYANTHQPYFDGDAPVLRSLDFDIP